MSCSQRGMVVSESVGGTNRKHALQAIEANKVEQLKLCGPVESSIDAETYLPQLASKLRSLHIDQCSYLEFDTTVNQFLGENNLDWAELILDLFSDGNKLDKLCIVNRWFPNYLSKAGAERLINELPRINRKIWFTATCDKLSEGPISENDYVVRVTPTESPSKRCRQFLEIKHTTRANERSMIPYAIL